MKYSATILTTAFLLLLAAPAATGETKTPTMRISTGMHVISTRTPHKGTKTHIAATNRAFVTTLRSSAATQAPSGYHIGDFRQSDATVIPDRLASTGDDYTTHSTSMQEEMMVNFINRDRAAYGLAPLTHDPELSRIARIKSEDMRDRGYFAHESPTYGRVRDMLRHFSYTFSGAGENIAHHATIEKAQAAFMSSEGHRRAILSRAWTKVGVGVCFDRHGYIYATQIFVR